MPKAHGNKLISRHLKKELQNLDEIIKIEINTNVSEDLLNIANGVFSPLKGFLCYNDLENIVKEKRLESDTPWTIPILLDSDKKDLSEGDTVLLIDKENSVRALLDIEEILFFRARLISKGSSSF